MSDEPTLQPIDLILVYEACNEEWKGWQILTGLILDILNMDQFNSNGPFCEY